jgi:hypothetical protein
MFEISFGVTSFGGRYKAALVESRELAPAII